MTPEHRDVGYVDMHKAFRGLALRKAAGPDGYALELYGKITVVAARIADLVNTVYMSGMTPKRLRLV